MSRKNDRSKLPPQIDAPPSWKDTFFQKYPCTPSFSGIPISTTGGVLMILLGNLLIHLYCQNGHGVDPVRVHTVPFFLVVAFAMVLLRDHLLKLWQSSIDPCLIVLPSVVGGILALVALIAGLPGLEAWIPVSRQGASILGDLELLLLPLITVGQLSMLARSARG